MIGIARKFFGKTRKAGSTIEEPKNDHDIRVATCALLLEMANVDGEFSAEEQHHIVKILKRRYQLSDEYVDELMVAARDELSRSLDYWQFAKLINQNYSNEEKIEIIEMVWQVIYVDGRLDKHEDYLMHKFSRLLRLPHKQFIGAKLRAKKKVLPDQATNSKQFHS